MACTDSTWALESSSIIGFRPNFADDCSCHSDAHPCTQDGQSVGMQTAAASSVEKFRKITRFHGRSWQDSFDFQEFGFSFNIADVAPADELFYKGQILPLQMDTRLHAVQALSSCHTQEEPVEVMWRTGRPSSVNRDDQVRFNSCRIEGAMHDKAPVTGNALLGAMRSLSFRSHHSGYWESGAEKDTTDTSSSSRDSNGSSQDSYFPNSSCKSQYSNYKEKPRLLPWKSFFGGLMRVSRRQHNSPPALPIVAFSEDLSKYRPVADLSFADAKARLVPVMSDRDVGQEAARSKSKFTPNQCRFHGALKGKPVLSDGVEKGALTSKSALKAGVEDGRSKSKSGFEDKELQQSIPQYCKEGSNGTMKAKFPRFSKGRVKGKCTNTDAAKGAKIAASRDAEGQKQRRSAVKERWQGYARKLKPLYDVKKGLMGQFRMDECGKNACAVESGIVRRPSWQRRLSHQSSLFKNHKLGMAHEATEGTSPYASSNNMQVAMSSCPPSTRSSPNHSGVLAVVSDNKANLHQSGGSSKHASNAGSMKKVISNESISMSTMHELHSAVQSAIAHCKESNRRHHLD